MKEIKDSSFVNEEEFKRLIKNEEFQNTQKYLTILGTIALSYK